MIQKFREESRLLDRQIKELEMKLRKAPGGELKCARNGTGVKWYYYKDTSRRTYLPKQNRTLAEKLALKKYNLTALEAARKKKTALDDCIRAYSEGENMTELLICPESKYKELLLPQISKLSSRTAEWAQEPYEKSEDHPENLRFQTKKGDMVRSKSEVFIANALYMNRVPYRYESKLDLAGYGIFFPDFLIYHPRLFKLYYWEHFGMMDDEDYSHKAYRKLEIYTRNGIVPMDNLIATDETRTNPLDPGIVEKIIRENFL